jgi:hypothetical protein
VATVTARCSVDDRRRRHVVRRSPSRIRDHACRSMSATIRRSPSPG